MTYHHQLPKELEFDVFEYVKTCKNTALITDTVYVKASSLFTDEMISVLVKHKLPSGTCYSVGYFVFNDIESCISCVIKMFETLQEIDEYKEYSVNSIRALKENLL